MIKLTKEFKNLFNNCKSEDYSFEEIQKDILQYSFTD